MVISIKIIFYAFLILSNILGYSQFLKKILRIKDNNILNNFILGSIAIAFLSYSINFISPLDKTITNTFFLIFTLVGIIYFFFNFKDFYIYFFLVLIFTWLITINSTSYNDYELYHLPYMELIRKFKIIFGLSNFDFRYAHASVFQNISAFQYNSLMKLDSYIFYTPILTILSCIFLIKKILQTNKFSIYIFSLVSSLYYIIHASRYGSLGNDYPTHILGILSIIFVLEATEKTKNDYFIFLSIITLIITSKFSMIFFLFLPIFIIFYFKTLFFGLSKLKIFFLILLTSLFLIKNFINSSCLIYPIPNLCISTKWLPKSNTFGSAEFISLESSVMVKSYMELSNQDRSKIQSDGFQELLLNEKQHSSFEKLDEYNKKIYLRYLSYKEYLKINNWLPYFIKGKDFKKFIKNSLVLNFIIFLIIFFIIKKKKIKEHKISFFKVIKLDYIFINFFLLFNFIFWFFNFPQLRYGLSYVLLFCATPVTLFFHRYEYIDNKNIFINLAKSLISIAIIYSIATNALRIYESNGDKISSDLTSIMSLYPPEKFEELKVSNFVIRQPLHGVCSNFEQLCSVFSYDFIETKRQIYQNNHNYYFIY